MKRIVIIWLILLFSFLLFLSSCSPIVRMPVEKKASDIVVGTYRTWVTKVRMDGYLIKIKGEKGWILMPKPFHKKDTLVYTALIPRP